MIKRRMAALPYPAYVADWGRHGDKCRMAAPPYPAYGCRFNWATLGDETPDGGSALSGLREIKGCGVS